MNLAVNMLLTKLGLFCYENAMKESDTRTSHTRQVRVGRGLQVIGTAMPLVAGVITVEAIVEREVAGDVVTTPIEEVIGPAENRMWGGAIGFVMGVPVGLGIVGIGENVVRRARRKPRLQEIVVNPQIKRG